MDYNTLLVHGNREADPLYHSVNVPIYLSSTFQTRDIEEPAPFGYSRGANPTRQNLEDLVAELEGGTQGFAFSSGMTATAAALSLLNAGDHLIVTRSVYGGTLGLLEDIYARWNISFTLVDTTDLFAVAAAFKPNTKALFIETPSNPTLEVSDIRALAAFAHDNDALLIVDNTFQSPYLQKPLVFGADVVVESATKFLSGHSDLIAGVAAVNSEALAQHIRSFHIHVGGIIQPLDAYLLTRSIKTLGVRIDRAQENALEITQFLLGSSAVDRVIYPGLPHDPGFSVHAAQSKGPGTLISFELNKSYRVETFLNALELVVSGASLGGVESLIGSPRLGSHRNYSPEQRAEAGIADNLIRLSVGIESTKDILVDLKQAFGAAVDSHAL